ncbi:hypothetical protein MKW98_023364 [Papaver atlanticum]|uniref:Uncharacterized protein n=1 Tax=Papaver atlanticum TaxID=357466 RepID=A0AAD4SWK2_9MAGN|nr:hypothetical protein MKW98_023364 [Papaver atlanticum]
MIFQGLKAAEPKCKCPVCREVGVYANPIHMIELDLLLKNRRRDYWKERMLEERSEMVKQSKEYTGSRRPNMSLDIDSLIALLFFRGRGKKRKKRNENFALYLVLEHRML